jgi:hypothetical protein
MSDIDYEHETRETRMERQATFDLEKWRADGRAYAAEHPNELRDFIAGMDPGGSENDGLSQDREERLLAPDGTLDALARDFHNIVGHKTAEYSRPVAIVGDQLVVEVDRGKSFGARDMQKALDSLGREDVDKVALRVTDRQAPRIESATPEELAARLWGPPVSSEKHRAMDLEMQQPKSRGMHR